MMHAACFQLAFAAFSGRDQHLAVFHAFRCLLRCLLQVRDLRAGYLQSLAVLRAAKSVGVYTKSSIMLGLGETEDEIIDTMFDLKVGCRPPLNGCLCLTSVLAWHANASAASHHDGTG
eukprot:GHRR01020103.1.p1 GENE.GHRR01020103.1~~GHRR01020103.1.p1  ORF type:complete len:118 (+),score=22.13 GHRR01020103.1:54-407(+)